MIHLLQCLTSGLKCVIRNKLLMLMLMLMLPCCPAALLPCYLLSGGTKDANVVHSDKDAQFEYQQER